MQQVAEDMPMTGRALKLLAAAIPIQHRAQEEVVRRLAPSEFHEEFTQALQFQVDKRFVILRGKLAAQTQRQALLHL